jgi:hypothetical protein
MEMAVSILCYGLFHKTTDHIVDAAYANGRGKFYEDLGVWKKAPLLKGTTQFEPLPDVKNIMITGGAGFMYVMTSFSESAGRLTNAHTLARAG